MMFTENMILLETCDSTNDHAKDLAKSGCDHKTVVRTKDQTKGRGRQGNVWTSFVGNLYMSTVFRPKTDIQTFGQMSFVTAVALANTIEGLGLNIDIKLKWPNDVLLNGKKVAGILLETENTHNPWIVVGTGVNIVDSPDGAISLSDVGYDGDVDVFAPLLISCLFDLYDAWQEKGFTDIQKQWMARAAFVNEDIHIRLPKETFTAKFLDIDHTGALRVERVNKGIQTISSGEVFGI